MSPHLLLQTVFALFLLLLGAFYALAGLVVHQHYRLRASRPFTYIMVSMALWSALYGLEIITQSFPWKIFWAKTQYFGIVSVPVFWLQFVLAFTGHGELLSPRLRRLLWVIPTITLVLVWTNEAHRLFWSRQSLGGPPLYLLVLEHGGYFWFYTLYSYGLILVGMFFLATSAIQLVGIYRTQSAMVFLGMLIALSGNAAYLGGAIPLPGLDVTPLTFLATTLSILWAIRRYHLLEVHPLSFESIVEAFQDPVFVVNHEQALLYMNPAAEELTHQRYTTALGQPLEEVCKFFKALRGELPAKSHKRLEISVEKEGEERQMEVLLQPLRAMDHHPGSTLLLLRDVTQAYQAQQAIERRDRVLQALSQAAVELMRTSQWETALPALLEALGRAADVSRVYLFRKHIEENVLLLSQTHEWAAPHAKPQIDNPALQNFKPMAQGFQRWVELLSNHQVIAGAVHTFPPMEQPILQEQDIRSLVVVPIFVEENWWGFIGFDECRHERRWSETEIDALRLVAELLGAAIRRQELQRETEQRQQVLDVMQEIILSALESETLEKLGQTLVDHLGLLIGSEHCFFTLWDTEQQRVIPLAAYGKYRERYHMMAPRPSQRTLTASALELRRTLIVEDTLNTPYLDPEIAAQFETRSMLVLPLIADGKPLGALLLGYSQPHRFTLQEIAIMERAAALVSLILLKFQAVTQAEQRARESETLRQAGAAVISSLQSREVVSRILAELRKVVPYDSASVQLLKDGELEIVGGEGWEDPSQVLGLRFRLDGSNPNTHVIQTLEPLVLKNTLAYPRFHQEPHSHIRSWMGVPLIAHGRAIGLLAIDSRRENFFTEEHVKLALAFANQVALALENARLYEEAQAQALTDSLTGLYNRRGLMELGKLELARTVRHQKPFSGIMLDIDHFKRVNDTYGHLVGDQVLQVIANRCEKTTRDLDLVGRYGGEEFLILLPEADWRAALNIANRLRLVVAEAAIPTRVGPLRVTISLGASQYIFGEEGLERLVERADKALYRAKMQGRNQAIAFEEIAQT